MSLTTLLKDAVHSDNVSKFSEIIINAKFSIIGITLEYLIAVHARTFFPGDFPWYTLLLDTYTIFKILICRENILHLEEF